MSLCTGMVLAKRSEGRPFDYSRQPERETPQPPAKCLSGNYSTPPSAGLKIASSPRCQETTSDGGYEEVTSRFHVEIQGVDIGRLAVILSNENTFWLVRRDFKFMRTPSNMSHYDPRYTVKMVKQLDSVMV
ncbi:hypothetical protein E2C01_032205 [Portunus trituberculatus]|uniref:Uncharacterized protein n=1 Tax=Portunus trituberculatus TaxID=210409 RepID=A0A5B7F268_PORTR|nr:hypothetical protein [Portunus trituberculatus]